jgi:hypothetical protein
MTDNGPGVATPWRERLRAGWHFRCIVTLAGALAMVIIAGVLVWNVVTAPHPLAQLVPGYAQTAEHRPADR